MVPKREFDRDKEDSFKGQLEDLLFIHFPPHSCCYEGTVYLNIAKLTLKERQAAVKCRENICICMSHCAQAAIIPDVHYYICIMLMSSLAHGVHI